LAIFSSVLERRDWLAFSRPKPALIKDMFRFGVPIAFANFADHVATKFDNLLVSSMFGKATMGLYNLAYNLAEIPSMHVGDSIADVLMPSFAKVDDEHRKDALVRSIGLMSLIVFPMAVGIGAVADTLVATLFNDAWQGIAPLLFILSILSIAHPMPNAIIVYLKASDRPKTTWAIQVVYLVAALTLVAGLAQWGMQWAALGAGLAAVLRMGVSAWIVIRVDGVPGRGLLAATFPVLAAALVMAGAVYGIRSVLGMEPNVLSLMIEIGTGAIAYVLAAFAIVPRIARDFLSLLRKAKRPQTAD